MRDVGVEGARRVEHVRPHPARCFLAVAFGDRAHHRFVLFPRTLQTGALAQLHATERVQSGPDGDCLLGEEVVMRGSVYSLVEAIMPIDIPAGCRHLAGFVDRKRSAAPRGVMR